MRRFPSVTFVGRRCIHGENFFRNAKCYRPDDQNREKGGRRLKDCSVIAIPTLSIDI
jgi:hypothetical protein